MQSQLSECEIDDLRTSLNEAENHGRESDNKLTVARELIVDLLLLIERAKREGNGALHTMHYKRVRLIAQETLGITDAEFCGAKMNGGPAAT